MQQGEHGIEYGGIKPLFVAEVIVNGGNVGVGAAANLANGRRFEAVLGEHFVGEAAAVRVLRGGEVRELQLELKPQVALVPRSRYDYVPTWFVFGGLVFQVLTLDYLRTWDEWWKNGPKEATPRSVMRFLLPPSASMIQISSLDGRIRPSARRAW